MSRREANLLWLKDLLEHLASCQKQLEWAREAEAVEVITETMIRDLDRCRHLCDSLRQGSTLAHVDYRSPI